MACRPMFVGMLLESDCVGDGTQADLCPECVGFRYRRNRLQKIAAPDKREFLCCAPRPHCRDPHGVCGGHGNARRSQAEAWGYSFLKHLKNEVPRGSLDQMC